MKNLYSLYRTLKDRYVPYPPDGSGRDRYVAYNNGGFFDKNSNSLNSNQNNKQTGTSFDTKIDYKYSLSPSIKAPNFHYHGDGTGRDSYIITNGGGLFYDSKSLNSYKLTDFLRKSEPNCLKSSNFGSKVSLSQMRYNKALREKEKSLIYRLYEQEKIKGKLTKSNKEEDENEDSKNDLPVQNNCSKNLVLPKVITKRERSCTETNTRDLKESSKNDEIKKEENETKINNLNTISHSGMKRNYTISNEHLMKNLEKLTKYDADKKNKRENQIFNQAYFHLRNSNFNTINA